MEKGIDIGRSKEIKRIRLAYIILFFFPFFLQYLLLNRMCVCKYLLFFMKKFCPHKRAL